MGKIRSVLIYLIFLQYASALRYRLGGFECPSGKIKSPTIFDDSNDAISVICEDLTVEIEDRENEETDGAKEIVVEVGSSPLPTKGNELLKKGLPVKIDSFNDELRKKTLSSISTAFKQCGNFFLIVSLIDVDGKALEFDSISLMKNCTDKPALSLKVEHRTKKVVGVLKRGSRNPFNIIGINKIAVVNEVQNCTFDKPTTGACGDQTDMVPRWGGEAPEVVAFYIPLSWEETMPDDKDSLLNMVGFKNGTGDTWFFNEPTAMKNLIKRGLKDLNMFDKPLFLHNSSILTLALGMEEGAKIGEEIGIIDLEKTVLPLGTPWQGLLIVALDPLEKFEDIDRSDNIFVQYVMVNGTDEDGNWLPDEPICNVQPVGKTLGRDSFITYNNFYEKPHRIFYNGKKQAIKETWGTDINKAQVAGQIAKMKADEISGQCSVLDSMINRDEQDNEPIVNRLGGLLQNVVNKFENAEHEAKDEAEKISMVLRLVSDSVGIVIDDEEIMGIVLKMVQKMARKKMNGHGRPGGRPGSGHGNGQGGMSGSGNGQGNGGWGNGQGGNGGWGNSGWGSETSTDDDWGDWGSESTTDGWGGWESSTSSPDGWDNWGGWGSEEETTMDWNNSNDSWGLGDETTMPNWNYEDYTTDMSDELYQPTFDELNDMDVDEIIYAFQMMDAKYMKKLLKENAKGLKKMMSKFSRADQYKIMQSMQSKTPVKQKVSISELQEMNATSVMRTFKTLNITFMRNFLNQYEKEINKVIDRFSREEQKDIRMIIEKRTKEKRPNFNNGSNGFNKTMNGSFPDINSNMTATELSKIFSKMGQERFENFTASLDEDTQWELYQILNGTKFGDFLEDIVYDDYDEEESAWGEVFGDTEEWGRRKKREIEQKQYARNKRGSGKGQLMGMMDEGMEDMSQGEKVAFMAAQGLQGLMMMDHFDTGKMPRFLSEIPSCLKQILWSPDDSNEGFICSKLPMDFKERIREILMMILKKDIPTSLFEIDWETIGENVERSGVFKEVANIAMTKIMLPLEASDITEMMKPLRELWTTIEKNETSTENKKVLKLVSAFMDAVNTEEVHENVADIARDVQEMVILKKSMAIMTGVPGPSPDRDSLCQLYARFALENSGKGGTRTKLEIPTAWLEKGGVIYKGELCPLSQKWFWTSVARCTCPKDMCLGGVLKGKGRF